ncbi:5-oxoprolinase subunit PxpA [Motilimonas eburnea]|nr:5-oxoprolinase subunit PxpA [Motilimonas eburnea]MCE2570158.1 5-oxoprolinase subunit PxpA [Motilimonas eburnea]
MKLNCDMGESFGQWQMGCDEAIMPHIDMANIACGFHASDPVTMDKTVKLAKLHHVTIGAHPGYPDLQGFGRRAMHMSPNEIVSMVQYQVGALGAICQANQVKLSYVKPHGALYHAMMQDGKVMTALMQGISALNMDLALMIQANREAERWAQLAKSVNLPLWFEAFADRRYQDTGELMPRSQAGAQLELDEMLSQAQSLFRQQQVISQGGQPLGLKADTLCVHGDNPAAVAAIAKLAHMRDSLEQN